MRYLQLLLIALASALCATYIVLWLTKPAPLENTTIPPLMIKEEQNELLVWGGWKTIEGYQKPGTNAVEIRCNRTSNTCQEAFATILHHTEGEDLEAQVFMLRAVAQRQDRLALVLAQRVARLRSHRGGSRIGLHGVIFGPALQGA